MGALPRLYLIADLATARRLGVDLLEVVGDFVAAGGRMVSLRPGAIGDRHLMAVGRRLAGLLCSVGGLFLMHRRADLAALLATSGIHLPSTGLARRDVAHLLGPRALVGRSCHERTEVLRARDQGASFVTLGPLFESLSKAGYGPGISMEDFQQIAEAVEIPIYALGGVIPDRVEHCLDAGAYGVAVVGGILQADDIRAITEEYLFILEGRRR